MYRSAEDERELADWLRWLLNASVSLVRMQYELDAVLLLEAPVAGGSSSSPSASSTSTATATATACAQNCAGELILLVAAHLHNNQLREVAQIVATRLNLKVLVLCISFTAQLLVHLWHLRE